MMMDIVIIVVEIYIILVISLSCVVYIWGVVESVYTMSMTH